MLEDDEMTEDDAFYLAYNEFFRRLGQSDYRRQRIIVVPDDLWHRLQGSDNWHVLFYRIYRNQSMIVAKSQVVELESSDGSRTEVD